MRREDLKDLSREQLERLICEWVIRYHRLEEETVKSQREKIDSILKQLEEEKGKTITISDGAITMRADMWEMLNENKALEDENDSLKNLLAFINMITNTYSNIIKTDEEN